MPTAQLDEPILTGATASREAQPEHAVDEDRIAFEQAWSPIAVSWRELCMGFLALGGWFLLFAGGILVGTDAYIKTLSTTLSPLAAVWAGTMIILFWTITNVGLLSCLAAILGAFGRRTRFTSRLVVSYPEEAAVGPTHADARSIVVIYASAIMRGFGVYSIMLAGLLVMATEALTSPTQGHYVRLASTISVVSFYAGYDPQMFAVILDRIKRLLDSKPS